MKRAWQFRAASSLGEGFTDLDADSSNLGLFVSNVFSLTDAVALTVSARYNRTDVTLEDQLGEELSGEHEFDRFNPAVGITFAATESADFVRGLQRGESHAVAGRAHLRRRGRPLQAAERIHRRSAARAGGGEDVRGRSPRPMERRALARGSVPHDQRRRHPVHQCRRSDQRRFLRQRRPHAPRGPRAQHRWCRGRTRHLVRKLHLHRCDVPHRVRGAEPEQS